jgi:hypothetical protein
VPMGRFIHVPPADPVSNWRNDFGLPWWQVCVMWCAGRLIARHTLMLCSARLVSFVADCVSRALWCA